MGKRKISELKKEISKTLNELFDVNIRWEKLSYEELNAFAEALLSKKFCPKVCGGKSIIKDLLELVDKVIPEDQQGPIIKGLKKLLIQ